MSANNTQSNVAQKLSPKYEEAFGPEYSALYNEHIAGKRLAHFMTIEEYRSQPPNIPSIGVLPGPDSADFEDHTISVTGGTIPIKVYYPKGFDKTSGSRPCYVNAHGGGGVIGAIDDDKSFLLNLVQATGCIVVDVGYRLAPEHKSPIGTLDCWEAYQWVCTNAEKLAIDSTRIAVGGFSAGGNIAAVLCQLARDKDYATKPIFQLLVIPVCDAGALDSDLNVATDCPHASWTEHFDAPFLSHARMTWFYRYLLPDRPSPSLLRDPLLSPLRAKSLASLPPALVVPAEIDVLRDEGITYAKRLAEESGSFVELWLAKGSPHPFPHQTGATPNAVHFRKLALQRLKEAFVGNLPKSGFVSNV